MTSAQPTLTEPHKISLLCVGKYWRGKILANLVNNDKLNYVDLNVGMARDCQSCSFCKQIAMEDTQHLPLVDSNCFV